MLKQEIWVDGRIRHYSDAGLMIRQNETGALYEDAVDTAPLRYSYEETNTPIPGDDGLAEAADYEAALQELGVIV